jgi:hypothetical protein
VTARAWTRFQPRPSSAAAPSTAKPLALDRDRGKHGVHVGRDAQHARFRDEQGCVDDRLITRTHKSRFSMPKDLREAQLARGWHERRHSAMSRWATGLRKRMAGIWHATIYLPDELKLALERTAAARGTSEAEVVPTP